MERKLWPSALIAAVCLVLALWVALGAPKDKRRGEAWAEFPLQSIKLLELETPAQSVSLQPLGSSSAWITVKDAKGPQVILAGEKVRDIWFALSPLWSTKSLGKFKASKMKDYGFDKERTLFRVQTFEGDARAFQIGVRGFQSPDYFVLDKSQNQVFLWNRETIDALKDPARLALKELSFFNPGGLNALLIEDPKSPDKNRALLKKAKLWMDGPKALSSDDPIIDWLERLSHVPIQGYRKVPGSSAQSLLRIAFQTESRWTTELFYEEKDQAFFLGFGPEKPQVLLKSEQVRVLWDEWNAGKIHVKN